MIKKTKYCPYCREHKSIENFDKEGKGRKDKNGLPKRRKMCSKCRWKRQKEKQELEKQDKINREKNIINAIIQLGRHDINRISNLSKNYFIEKTNGHDIIGDIDFGRMKERAIEELYSMGFHRLNEISLQPGRYLIVGDSHGIHTDSRMYELLENINNELNIDNIIHIGHLLDDNNDISPDLLIMDNLIVLSRIEEANLIEEYMESKGLNCPFEIIREEIKIGDYNICNQDIISDYVKTFIGNLDSEIFPYKTITSSHRHEMDVRCSYEGRSIIMSPGCLCEKHIIKTIKQIDFKSGCTVKLAYHDGFSKYRRMRHMCEYWQHGAILVDYDGNMVSCTPMRIKKINNSYVTSYFDKIITSDGIEEPDNKIFVNGDIHVAYHDDDVLDIQDQVCKDYNPDIFVTLGDTYNCSALNHHILDRGGVISDVDILEEMAVLNYVLKKMSRWADKKYIFFGNHERFLEDFAEKFPQLSGLLDFKFISSLEDLDYELIKLRDVLDINGLRFIHGDMRMYGGKGRKIERASRVFGDCILGHIHYPACRFNCYSVGLSGKMDHEYNEPNASNWTHSFLLCNQYEGESFISPIIISDYNVLINDKKYSSKNSDFSSFSNKQIKIVYTFED